MVRIPWGDGRRRRPHGPARLRSTKDLKENLPSRADLPASVRVDVRGPVLNGLISFPKSGRTWLRLILDELGVELGYTHAGSDHKYGRHLSELDLSAAGQYERIVLLVRDPRDTVVSGYHQATKRLKKKYVGSMSEFIRDPHYGIEKTIAFNRLWLGFAVRNPDTVHVIHYEQLRDDTIGRIADVLAFLDQPRKVEEVRSAVENTEFSKLQQREIAGSFQPEFRGSLGATDPNDRNSLKVRSGKVGGFVDELSAADISYCNNAMVVSAQSEAGSAAPQE